ncbi:MAG: hypothetical protein GY849_03880 [Deltaproteobacteria bacterium]|nr:hypothetical protein [Deltaproteobacteria bacterium]
MAKNRFPGNRGYPGSFLQQKEENDLDQEKERGSSMRGIWVFLAIIVLWFLLQAYILPKFGIST